MPNRRQSVGQVKSNVKFSAVATAMKWLMDAPGGEDTNIKQAKKFMDTTAGMTMKPDNKEFVQAKCWLFVIFLEHFICNLTK